jgi:ABC-type sugar transport system ATPase subunit
MMAATTIEFRSISKTYSNGHAAIRGVELTASAGEFLVLVGPSGSGKSTLLRLLAGLDQPSSGRIVIGGVDVTESPPQDRDLAMVFQSYALYPHMTVRDNLAYGLKVRRTSRATTDKKVAEVAGVLGIEPLLDRRPAQLSGGERQRVALGRALVREPKAFLLDEPLSNLDPSLRAHARAELRRLHQSLGATIVYVTHDQEEAMTLGTRVAVMRAGAVEQVAPPLELYSRPANTFVAGFIGSPSMNLLEASMLGIVGGAADGAAADGGAGIVVGIRPHDVSIGTIGSMAATVELVEPRGHDFLVHLRLSVPGSPMLVAISRDAAVVGALVYPQFPREHVHLFGNDGRRLEDRDVRE